MPRQRMCCSWVSRVHLLEGLRNIIVTLKYENLCNYSIKDEACKRSAALRKKIVVTRLCHHKPFEISGRILLLPKIVLVIVLVLESLLN
jgi:hypothetical protein